MNLNYVHTTSETEYPDRPGELLKVADTPETEVKISLTWERDPWFVQMRYEYEGESLDSVSELPDEDSFEFAKGEIELSINYEWNENIRIFAEVENLLNEPQASEFEGDASRITQYRWAPREFKFGLKFEL